MAQDEFLPRGSTKASKPTAGGANIRSVPVIGIVKNNIDPIRAGRIQVYLLDNSGTDPDDSDSWKTVNYLSTFFGFTRGSSSDEGYGTYSQNPASYGQWNSPPDIGTRVVCIFVNGDENYGYYIGCIPEPETLYMVPAIGATDNIVPNEGEAQSYGGATRLPVSNLNVNNEGITENPSFLKDARPVHSYAASVMFQQGILRDPVRGAISSSSQRETPSRVGWGVSTPGRPIYEGGFTDESAVQNLNSANPEQLKIISRRAGHTIVMDDGDQIGRDQLVRIRTAMGHQILMSDDGQCLLILHSNGQSYIELGKEGTIDMYATNSVNIRTQGDLNLHADNNINVHAKKNFNLQAENINVNTEKEFKQRVGTNFLNYTMGKYMHKVDGTMSWDSKGVASYASSDVTYINGSKINLNTGSTSAVPEVVPPIPVIAHTDTLFDATKGFIAAPAKLISITSRAPAHQPWVNAGQGVDVKVSLNASSELPSPPSAPVTSLNAASQGAAIATPTVASAATVPGSVAVSTSLDKATTGTLVSATATSAVAGPAASAVAQGAGIVNTAQGAIAAVGSTALNPKQLQTAGILKPGAATLVNGLTQGGANVNAAMTTNLFTGKPGAETLGALVQNPAAQVNATVVNLQKAQTALTSSGVLTGKEAPGAIAGVVNAASSLGVAPTLDALKTVAANPNSVSSLIPSSKSLGAVSQAVSSGNFAAGLATNVTGGLGAVAGALAAKAGGVPGLSGAIDQAKGLAGSAFSAISASFKPLKAGIPQNLTQIAKQAEAQVEAESQSVPDRDFGSGDEDPLAGLTPSQIEQLGDADATDPFIRSRLGLPPLSGGSPSAGASASGASLSNLLPSSPISGSGSLPSIPSLGTGLIPSAAGITGVSSTLASGLSSLPGGQSAVSSVFNNAPGVKYQLPGGQGVSNLIKNASTSALNNISLDKAATSGLTGALSSVTNGLNAGSLQSAIGSVAGSLTGGLDKLKSGSGSLASLALSGIPAGIAAQMNSALSSLSSGGSLPIKVPAVAINTTNRDEIGASVTSTLGDAKIPPPAFGQPPSEGAKTALQKQLDKQNEISNTVKELQKLREQSEAAQKAYYQAKADLPQGDPKIQEALDNWTSLVDSPQRQNLKKKLAELSGIG